MKEELKKLWIGLMQEKPSNEGRAVSPELYVEAIHYLTWFNPKIVLLASEDIMNKTGVGNTMFAGHFIYPDYATRLK